MLEGLAVPWLLLALFIFIAFTTEAMTGFGSIVIALSLGALVLPIVNILPVLVPLNIAMTSTLAWRHRQAIDWPTLWRLILPLMAVGTVGGYLLLPWLGDHVLKQAFGALVVWFSGRELWRLWRGIAVRARGQWYARGWVLMAGMTHGLFASGGPLLVYALSGLSLDKHAFRATLIVVWLTLNSLLTVLFAFDGTLMPALPRIAWLLPVVVFAMVLGEKLHHRIDDARFRQWIFRVLLITGVALIIA